MQKMEDQLHHPLGICQKVFKFMSRLFSPGLQASIEVKVQHQDQDDQNTVEIHFKQTEEDLDSWTPIDNLGSSLHLDYSGELHFKKTEATKDKELPLVQVNGNFLPQVRRRRAEPTTQKPPKRETQKSVRIKQSTKNKASEKNTVQTESKEPQIRYPPRLLTVAPNINEKSESFIKTRMEAMRKNLGLEPEES